MCGIYATNHPFDNDRIQNKLYTINYRGPDNTGISRVGTVILGHLRLSILDLDSRSNQPFVYENLHITFNGEIYNYRNLRDELVQCGHTFRTESDTETILAGYKEWGKNVLNKMNGMFAFCIYDDQANRLFCARDRLGVKPFYYSWNDGLFEICSQLKPLSSAKEISQDAVSMYLDCTYIPSPFSIFEDVFKLPPGNFMEIDLTKNELRTEEYWNLQEVEPDVISYEKATEELHTLLKDAVRIRLQSDVPIGSFLSGGIDSALVSSIAASITEKPINTLSIGFENKEFDESIIAEGFANIIQSQHTTIFCTAQDVLNLIPKLLEVYDEPFADSSALPSLLLNSKAKNHVTVALSGDGGDESFLGYYHFDWVAKFSKLLRVPYFIRKLCSRLVPFGIFRHRADVYRSILETKTLNQFIEKVFVGFNSIVKERKLDWLSHYRSSMSLSKNPIQKTADLNIKLWLENDSNVKTDRASMAYSVEIRSPFLDYRIVEFARRLPITYRYEKGNKKKILKDILASYIPKEKFDQPKKGFSIPLDEWIRKDLRSEFIETLSDTNLEVVPNLDVKKFRKMFKLHLKNQGNYSSYIWRVYVFIKWYQTHLEKETPIEKIV